MQRKWKDISSFTWDAAHSLRKEQTATEKRLWSCLRGNQIGTKIRRQHPIGPYIVDFFVPACNLVIELDGEAHDTHEQRLHDADRSEYLRAQGLRILRFRNQEVNESLDWVLDVIRREISPP